MDKRCKHIGSCRGRNGLGYAAFEVPFGCGIRAEVHARPNCRPVPCALYDTPTASEFDLGIGVDRRIVIVAFPLLGLALSIDLIDGEGRVISTAAHSPRMLAVASRVLSSRRPELVAFMRGIERRRGASRTRVELVEVWPGEERQNAWRFRASFPTADDAASLRVAFENGRLNPIELDYAILEDHAVPSKTTDGMERIVTFSVLVPDEMRHLLVSVSLEGLPTCSGFACGFPSTVNAMLDDARCRATGQAASRTYGAWFDEHRATSEQIDAQRAASLSMLGPCISIVVPVFKTNPRYLSDCINSVLSQSYSNWELVLVNASPEDTGVQGVLAGYQDSRIKVVEAANQSISDNTNVGIETATGDFVAFLDHDDFLESDALWWYIREIQADSLVDVLYCDEDRFRNGRFVNPAFKSAPDIIKLRSYNYVTHFLMVSRYVLNHTERSAADVSGAQDYDLTLKAFEVARGMRHIPRILYHWREHDGSTAGGSEQKPYAHTAGRIALERHLARVGQAGRVEDGPLSCTYRVQYALPGKLPLVSVVIPSKDHASLLRRCVASILDKSTYPRLEVVVVENNSVEAETLACYRELEQDARVHVVYWNAEMLPEGTPLENGFNYSALVNFGAAQSAGEVLVFLNNDTEVIEPAWIEEMLGVLQMNDVGLVGAKLLFEDGLVQHAGMTANARHDFAHVNRNLSRRELGYAYSAGFPQEYAMVTGACQMVSRDTFDMVGGYDEQLAVGFNDGDFCLSVREGGRKVVYQPYALLYHREFSTRAREAEDVRTRARMLREKSYIISKHPAFFCEGDPAINPNFDRMSDWWELPDVNR